jgi:hypothetical protein
MKKLLLSPIIGLALLASSAHAQVDHLTCFKAKDSGKFDALATLDAVQDAFDPGQCKILGRAKLFCVPTSKALDEFTVDKVPAAPLPVAGIDPQQDHVCYKIKCPKATIADTNVSDQFGARALSKFKAQLICVPAVKGLVTTTTTTTTLPAPVCDGSDEACLAYQGGGACATCCDGDVNCQIECTDAVNAGCASDLQNGFCTTAMNAAACAATCCP